MLATKQCRAALWCLHDWVSNSTGSTGRGWNWVRNWFAPTEKRHGVLRMWICLVEVVIVESMSCMVGGMDCFGLQVAWKLDIEVKKLDASSGDIYHIHLV